MTKNLLNIFSKYKIWLIAILLQNLMYGLFFWIIDIAEFIYILPSALLGSIILYSLIIFIIYSRDKRKAEAFIDFIETPDLYHKTTCNSYLSNNEKEILNYLSQTLTDKDDIIKQQKSDLKEYEEYIESWAHEIKTPLSLMTLVLDNRRDEISLPIYNRLEYSRTKIQEDIEKILYYARIESDNLDYLFKKIYIDEILKESIDEYKILIYEQNITIENKTEHIDILSDSKGLMFILMQILSNSIKYIDKTKSTPSIILVTKTDIENNEIILTIRDTGIGIQSYDLPFIFCKGFTGYTGENSKSSTGLGLYLANQVADRLKIKLKVSEDYTSGFEISLHFPIIK